MIMPAIIDKKKFHSYLVVKIAVEYAPIPKNAACVTDKSPEYPITKFKLTPKIVQIDINIPRCIKYSI
jgi:hypothetical protein